MRCTSSSLSAWSRSSSCASAEDWEPGSKRGSSSSGYAIVAAVLEHVFGSSFEDVLRGELFEPLALDAGFGWPSGPIGHYCRNGVLEAQTTRDGYTLPPALTGGLTHERPHRKRRDFFAIVVVQPDRDFAAAAIVNAAGEQAEAAAIEVVRALVRERTG
jgi:CubicO group peptidase (beta-lactamase class C family)